MILYEIENGLDEEYINVVKERIAKFPQLMQDMLSDTYTKFCIVKKYQMQMTQPLADIYTLILFIYDLSLSR